MPNIKFNSVAIKKLIDVGGFEKWKSNLETQWNHATGHSGNGKLCTIQYLESLVHAHELIKASFAWDKTPEGWDFWSGWYWTLFREEEIESCD